MARTATRLVAAARSYHPDPVVARLQAALEEAFHSNIQMRHGLPRDMLQYMGAVHESNPR